jgi:hypothetical protein
MPDLKGMPNGKMVLLGLAFMTRLNTRMEESYDRGDDRAVRTEILDKMFSELEAHELVVLDMALDFLAAAVGWVKVMVPHKLREQWNVDEFYTKTAVIDTEEKFQETVAQLREKYSA